MDVKQFVKENNQPFVTSGDVSQAFPDASERLIRKRLRELAEEGELQRREIGGSGVVYWLQG